MARPDRSFHGFSRLFSAQRAPQRRLLAGALALLALWACLNPETDDFPTADGTGGSATGVVPGNGQGGGSGALDGSGGGAPTGVGGSSMGNAGSAGTSAGGSGGAEAPPASGPDGGVPDAGAADAGGQVSDAG
jgi:hypothetical protein